MTSYFLYTYWYTSDFVETEKLFRYLLLKKWLKKMKYHEKKRWVADAKG